MTTPASFDPHSPNAMFATILERLDNHESQAQERHDAFVKMTADMGARVGKLEHAQTYQRGMTVVIAGAVSAVGAGAVAWVKSKITSG